MSLDDTARGNIVYSDLEDYNILKDAYDGGEGFKDGTYLTPHWRESATRYNRRRNDCWYLNVFKPIINAHTDSIYKTEPQRDLNNVELEAISQDADGKGNSANVFFKRATREATLQGKTYILVENSTNPETNRAAALEKRDLPYLVLITRNRVEEEDTVYDKFGNILQIKYWIKKKVEGKEKKFYKTWTIEAWFLSDEEEKIIESGVNELGVVPIVQYYGTDTDELNPMSDFFQVAKAAHRVFNLTSNIQEQEDNQMYSILTLPRSGKDQKSLGTSNALTFDPASSKGPSYITPGVEPIKVLVENLAALVVTMYDMSNLAIIKSTSNTSGESKRWDYEKTETVLSGRALSAENTEQQTWRMIQLYLGLSNDISVRYTRKFTFIDAEKEVQKALDLLEMNLGAVGNAEVKKISVHNAFNYIPEDTTELIFDSIDEQAKEDETMTNIIEEHDETLGA